MQMEECRHSQQARELVEGAFMTSKINRGANIAVSHPEIIADRCHRIIGYCVGRALALQCNSFLVLVVSLSNTDFSAPPPPPPHTNTFPIPSFLSSKQQGGIIR